MAGPTSYTYTSNNVANVHVDDGKQGCRIKLMVAHVRHDRKSNGTFPL